MNLQTQTNQTTPNLPVFASSVYKPLTWQIDPWRDTSPRVLLTGSVGGGKSTVCAEKCHGFAMKYPG